MSLKMAKADNAEWKALVDWFNDRESKHKSVPDWRRVIFGYRVLVDTACDPDKDYLDWKPGLIVQSKEEVAA